MIDTLYAVVKESTHGDVHVVSTDTDSTRAAVARDYMANTDRRYDWRVEVFEHSGTVEEPPVIGPMPKE